MKFKIGDKVKIKKFDKDISGYNPNNFINQIGVVKEVVDELYPYVVQFDEESFLSFAEEELGYDKPCKYCTENKSLYFDSKYNNPNLHEVYIEDDGNMTIVPYLCNATESVQIKINYCPMCGKELVLN